DGNPGCEHLIANLTQERLIASGLENMIVDPVIARWSETVVTGAGAGVIVFVVQIEFQFAGYIGMQAKCRQTLNLAPQDRAWRLLDQLAVMMMKVAKNQSARSLPRNGENCGHVRAHLKISEPGIPVRQRETVLWFHLDVDGEEVVAAVRGPID